MVVSNVQDADVGLMLEFHIHFFFPVCHLDWHAFGACYAKAYQMHRKDEQIRSKAAERAASGSSYQEPILVQQKA